MAGMTGCVGRTRITLLLVWGLCFGCCIRNLYQSVRLVALVVLLFIGLLCTFSCFWPFTWYLWRSIRLVLLVVPLLLFMLPDLAIFEVLLDLVTIVTTSLLDCYLSFLVNPLNAW